MPSLPRTRPSLLRSLCLGVLLLTFFAIPAAAQERVLRGTIVDETGAPIAGQNVVLHTVTESGGAPVGQAVSDASGVFSIPFPAGLHSGAVVFAAARVDEQLYIGPMIEDGVPPESYTLVAGGGSPFGGLGTAGAPGTGAGAASPSKDDGSPLALIVFLPLAALVGFFLYRAFGDPQAERRRLLLELARCEERLTSASGEELAVLTERRAALRARLMGTPATDPAVA